LFILFVSKDAVVASKKDGIRVALVFKVMSVATSSLSSSLPAIDNDKEKRAQSLLTTLMNDPTLSYRRVLIASLRASEIAPRLTDVVSSINQPPSSTPDQGKTIDGVPQLGIILTSAQSAVPSLMSGIDHLIVNHLRRLFVDTGLASSVDIHQILVDFTANVETGYEHERPSCIVSVYSLSDQEVEWLKSKSINPKDSGQHADGYRHHVDGSDVDDDDDDDDGDYDGDNNHNNNDDYEKSMGPHERHRNRQYSSRQVNIPFYHIGWFACSLFAHLVRSFFPLCTIDYYE
jgi:hypothetical protein